MNGEKYEITKEYIEKEYFQNGLSQYEIAKKVGCSQTIISDRMIKFGLKTKEKTWKLWKHIYSVDETYFDELNDENAWVLGWLASDGYVIIRNNSHLFGLKLAEKDKEIIYKIKDLLNFNGVLYKVKQKLEKTGKEYNQIQIKITSKQIVKNLEKYGVVQNKSKIIKFPKIIEELNNELITKNFILGVFEGDGSVLFDEKYSSPCFQIVGTKELLTGIQKQLIKYLGISKTKLTKNSLLGNHYMLRYRGRFQAVRIFDWLYLNQKHYLKRKYRKYIDIKRRLSL